MSLTTIRQNSEDQLIKHIEIWTDGSTNEVRIELFGAKGDEYYLNLLRDAIPLFINEDFLRGGYEGNEELDHESHM